MTSLRKRRPKGWCEKKMPWLKLSFFGEFQRGSSDMVEVPQGTEGLKVVPQKAKAFA